MGFGGWGGADKVGLMVVLSLRTSDSSYLTGKKKKGGMWHMSAHQSDIKQRLTRFVVRGSFNACCLFSQEHFVVLFLFQCKNVGTKADILTAGNRWYKDEGPHEWRVCGRGQNSAARTAGSTMHRQHLHQYVWEKYSMAEAVLRHQWSGLPGRGRYKE